MTAPQQCPHCARLRADLERSRRLLRATLALLTDLVQLTPRAHLLLDAVYEELGMRRTVHERETVPEMAAADDDEVSAGETIFVDPEGL